MRIRAIKWINNQKTKEYNNNKYQIFYLANCKKKRRKKKRYKSNDANKLMVSNITQ